MEPLTILGYPHAPDGSGYYRFWLPFEFLAHFCDHKILLPSPGEKFTPNSDEVDEFDMIVGQRFMNPDGITLCTRWREKVALVYECDDNLLEPDTSSGLAHLFDPQVQQTIKDCLGLAHLVTVSTEPLAEMLRPYNDNIKIVPNHVHGDMLYIDRPHRDRPTVGWSGGMSHLQDWTIASDPVGDVLRDRPDWDFHFLGIDYSPMLKIPNTRFTPWTPHVWTFWRNIDFDIGLAPLADTPFNRCKSHIRALEYMALGIPVIASDVPAYRDLVVDGVTGYLVSSEDEWADRLRELVEDEAQREEMGAKGREVAAGWVIQRGWKYWRDAYEDVTGWTP